MSSDVSGYVYGYLLFSVSMATPKPSPERKQYGLRLSVPLMRDVKHLAVDENKPMNDLVEEGLQDLLTKYRDKRKHGEHRLGAKKAKD